MNLHRFFLQDGLNRHQTCRGWIVSLCIQTVLVIVVDWVCALPGYASCGARLDSNEYLLLKPTESFDAVGVRHFLAPSRQWLYEDGKVTWRVQRDPLHESCPECRRSQEDRRNVRNEAPVDLSTKSIARASNSLCLFLVQDGHRYRLSADCPHESESLEPIEPPPRDSIFTS